MQSGDPRHSEIAKFGLEEFSHSCQEMLELSCGSSIPRSLHQSFSRLLENLRHHLRFDYVGIGLVQAKGNLLELILQAGNERMPSEIPIHRESLGVLLDGQLAIEVSDVDTESQSPDLCELARAKGFRSFRVVPLNTCGRTLGAIGISRRQAGEFSDEDVRCLDHTAELIALVLENAVMANALNREKFRLETLLNVNTALISSVDMQEVLPEVSALIRRILNQDFTYIALYDKNHDAMKFYVLRHGTEPQWFAQNMVPLADCPAGITYRQGKMLQFTHDDLALIASDHARGLLAAGIRTVSCFPLISHGRSLGTLGIASLGDGTPSQDDLALLTQIATQVAVSIDNARAYDEIAVLKDKLSKEKLYLEDEIRSEHNFGEVVGNSHALSQVFKDVEIAAPSDATVLVLGETGTGKELIARAVHRLSSRREGNFIKLNCAAIPTGLLESELFGHEKGAFTGAISQKMGRLELADKGTLFLDEIGDIPLELQPKLLRVLQDHEFERLGGVRTIRVNVRLVAATNRDLAKAVEENQFRKDLYYRLNVFPIRLPALRERAGDIPLLVRYFVQKFARRMGKRIESIPVEIIRELERWRWPGNIRELENFIERSVILTQGTVLFAPVSELRAESAERVTKAGTTLESLQRNFILRTLRDARGVIAGSRGAAARLGMKRTTLQSRMQKLGITRQDYDANQDHDY
jgi:formate hydrogenlyase transcriptional activator